MLVFAQIAEEMSNRHEDLVCALYNAGDPGSTQTEFSNIMGEVLSEAIIGLPPELEQYGGPFEDMFSTILPYLLPNSLFNKLFVDDIDVQMYEGQGSIDCTACEETGPYTVVKGTEQSDHPANPIEILAEDDDPPTPNVRS